MRAAYFLLAQNLIWNEIQFDELKFENMNSDGPLENELYLNDDLMYKTVGWRNTRNQGEKRALPMPRST